MAWGKGQIVKQALRTAPEDYAAFEAVNLAGRDGVRVLDVSNPTQPRQVAHYNTFRETDPGRTEDMFEGAIGIRVPGDGYVYVVDTTRGLLIFDAL